MTYYPPQQNLTYYPLQNVRNPGESTAIAGFICSLVGLFVPLLGIVGLVLSLNSRRKSLRSGYPHSGLATAGLVLGIIGTVFWAFTLFGLLAWHEFYVIAPTG